MNAFSASQEADQVRVHLMMSHAYRNAKTSDGWERSNLVAALLHFEKLAACMPVIRERLAELPAHEPVE